MLEVDDIETCSAEGLKFCTSLAPKIPSNPWPNIANITEKLLIVVSTSLWFVVVNHVSKKERIQISNNKPLSHFFLILIWDYFRKQGITEVYLNLHLHLFEGLTVPKFLPFQAFCDTSETETWKNWIENMTKKIV